MQEEIPSASVQAKAIPQTPVMPHHHRRVLFEWTIRPHVPQNVNAIHKAEQAAAGFNTRLAVGLTQRVGTMWTAYTFAVLAIIGLFAILGVLTPLVALLVAWVSQTFIQLVLLPIIMVGQNVLGRKAELQADEQFHTTMSTYHDIEQVMLHLCAQDAELLRHAKMLEHLLEKSGISLQQLEREVATTSHLDSFIQPPATTATPATPTPGENEKQNA